MTNPDPTLPHLWQRLRSMFARASTVIAALPTLATIATLTHTRRYEIACWIARLESIARKLLFAEAARLQPASTLPAAASRASNDQRRERHPIFDPAHPHTWPARFKLTPPRDPRAVPENRAPRIRALWGDAPSPEPRRNTAHAAKPRPAAMRLALRFEALRRVLENPLPHARRLARIFHRLGCRYPEAAGRYAVASARPHASDPGDPRLIIECMMLAIAAAEIFANTS